MQLAYKEKQRLLQRYGTWAVVTGASSGIGAALVKQLAEAGFNLLLISRQSDVLEQLEKELTTAYGITNHTVAADLSEPAGVEAVLQAAGDLPIGLLIACAGFGSSGLFIDSSAEMQRNMLRLNCEGLLLLTHHFSKRFAQQNRGVIILMSSIVAFQGVPYAAHYAATKAYVQSLAEALAFELKSFGVDVLSAAPGPVHSGFASRANMRMGAALTPSQVAVPILKSLGRKTTALPGLLTKVLAYSLRTVPRWGKIRIMAKVMGGMTKHQRQTK